MNPPVALRILAAVLLSGAAQAADKYPDFAALSSSEREGKDFRITTLDRRSPVAVLAIHGGSIEPGSDAVARAVARGDWSLYVFESLKPGRDDSLHITATSFDEPQALALVGHSAVCVSVHGSKGDRDGICLGGSNPKLRRAVHEALEHARLDAALEEPCKRLPGIHPKNIGNRCEAGGVQVELTASIRERLRADPSLAEKIGAAIRDGVQAYRKDNP
jgi:phage replication-related protein YjqB (UPF0714/DUF867 family)